MFKVPKNPASFSLAYKGEFNPFYDFFFVGGERERVERK